jgi:hypothetical protein
VHGWRRGPQCVAVCFLRSLARAPACDRFLSTKSDQ